MIRSTGLIALAVAGVAAAQTQSQLTDDAAVRFRRADAALNAQYRATLAEARQAGATDAAALLASQRAWLQFRDAECARIANGYRGGSMQTMEELGCEAQLTEQRTRQLKGDPH